MTSTCDWRTSTLIATASMQRTFCTGMTKVQRLRRGHTDIRMKGRENNMARAQAYATMFWLLLFAQSMIAVAQQPANPAPHAAPPLRIGPGDLIDVVMFENPDLSGKF